MREVQCKRSSAPYNVLPRAGKVNVHPLSLWDRFHNCHFSSRSKLTSFTYGWPLPSAWKINAAEKGGLPRAKAFSVSALYWITGRNVVDYSS